MATRKFPWCRVAPTVSGWAAACGILFLAGSSPAQQPYSLRDGGKTRSFVLATDEIHVVRPAASPTDLKSKLETTTPGATVREARNGRAMLQLPAAGTPQSLSVAAARLSRDLPGTQTEAVLYPRTGPRNPFTRRIATRDVLVQVPARQTAAALAASVAATEVRPTPASGHVILRFPSGFAALEGAEKLEARGLQPVVQLRRQHEVHAVPDDAFFSNQWHLRNASQGGGVLGVDANVVSAWDITRGAGVTIAIVDESLETDHPDLDPNTPPLSSGFHLDVNGGDNNPAPESGDEHGTAVGGVAAARGNNAFGVSGSAPEAQLVGVRLISAATTDLEDAEALYWHPPGLTVGVSNSSWGPTFYYAGADTLAKLALQEAATSGRGGRGQITLFSAGNSQEASRGSRDANANSFANSRYVIAVAASNNFGEQSTYSQRGANVLVCAPSSDPFNLAPRLSIWTTDNLGGTGYNPGAGEPSAVIDPDQAYTNSFGGTSSASPLTAGCVALMLAAAPNLGWRDVHEIVAATAVQLQPVDSDWVINGGGFKFNHKYGGGMINATAAVVGGMNWQNLAAEEVRSRSAATLPVTVPDNNAVGATIPFDFTGDPNLRVERAEIVLRMVHGHRSDVEIVLTSPAGTQSILSELRPRPAAGDFRDDDINVEDNGQAWTFTTTHSWGENSTGTWTLTARDRRAGTSGSITVATLRLYGTPAPLERVGFELPAYTVNEAGGSQSVRIRRVGPATASFSVDVVTAAQGTATDGADFQGVTQTLNFANGEQFKDVNFDILQDNLPPEPAETIFLVLKNPVNVALGGVALTQVTIQDDETRPVSAVAGDAIATETLPGATTDPGTIVISRATPDANELIVNLQIGGTATNGSDYSATVGAGSPAPLPISVTIPPLAASVTLQIRPTNDSAFEGTESVEVTVLPGIDYDVGPQSAALVSLRDDERPKIDITALAASVAENSPTRVNFKVERDVADPGQSVIVKLRVEGTAVPGENYVDLPEQVEIPAGQKSILVPLQPIDDDLYIPLKTVTLRLFVTPDYKEGFSTSATIRIVEDDPLPDARAPSVVIKSPIKGARINAPLTVLAKGTAKDNLGVVRVLYALNDGLRRTAAGTTAWTADLTADLLPGPNKLSVQSEDADGNLSAPAVVNFSYVQLRTLTVSITTNGAADSSGGTVTKAFLTPVTREAGQMYTITATPRTGFVFAGWSGGLTGLARTFTFKMPDADTSLVAAFITDPFLPGIQGVYTGPVQAATFAWESSGMLQITLTARGACSGILYLAGAQHRFKSEFNGVGRLRLTVSRPKSTPVQLDLTLDPAAPVLRIVGTVTSPDFNSSVDAERAGFSKTVPYPLAVTHPKGETYTFVLPAATSPPPTHPLGAGFGTFTIDASGNVKWTATLPDSSATASGGAPLTTNLRSVLYASLYAAKGLLLGELQVDKSAATSDCTATFDWFKPANLRDSAFTAGFTRSGATLDGSLYTPPPKPATATVFKTPAPTTGTIDLTGGNITNAANVAAQIHDTFTLGLDHKFTVNGVPPNGLTVAIDPAKGLFSGSFIDAKFPKKTLRKFRGVILQKQQRGWGGFLGDTLTHTALQTGTVSIAP